MTAPLPPLPQPVSEVRHETDGFVTAIHDLYSEDQMQAYAKLAVRQALEQVLIRFQPALEWVANDPCAGAYQEQAKQAVGVVRAMIEEYKDD